MSSSCCVDGRLFLQSSLMLSGEQRSELVQLRQLFLAKLQSIVDYRTEVLTTLCDAAPPSPGSCGERISAAHYLKVKTTYGEKDELWNSSHANRTMRAPLLCRRMRL